MRPRKEDSERTSPSPPKRPWQLVVADNCGPFKVQYGGHTHIALFIEAWRSVGFIFERNSLTGEESADYLATVDNLARKTSNGIENFRTDEGSDWKSSAVAEGVRDCGIHH